MLTDASAFALTGGAGLCNAVRRALCSDVETWAACAVYVRRNTSCETDEFLAHRIGLLPLRQTDAAEDCTLALRAVGPRTVYARDLVGARARPVLEDVPLVRLGKDQEIDLEVRLDRRRASVHPRYAPCSAVGMEPIDHGRRHRLLLLSNDDRTPRALVEEALVALLARVQEALHQLAHQPGEPPKDMN